MPECSVQGLSALSTDVNTGGQGGQSGGHSVDSSGHDVISLDQRLTGYEQEGNESMARSGQQRADKCKTAKQKAALTLPISLSAHSSQLTAHSLSLSLTIHTPTTPLHSITRAQQLLRRQTTATCPDTLIHRSNHKLVINSPHSLSLDDTHSASHARIHWREQWCSSKLKPSAALYPTDTPPSVLLLTRHSIQTYPRPPLQGHKETKDYRRQQHLVHTTHQKGHIQQRRARTTILPHP